MNINDKRPVFPFTAISGQIEMKLALLLNIMDPKVEETFWEVFLKVLRRILNS